MGDKRQGTMGVMLLDSIDKGRLGPQHSHQMVFLQFMWHALFHVYAT